MAPRTRRTTASKKKTEAPDMQTSVQKPADPSIAQPQSANPHAQKNQSPEPAFQEPVETPLSELPTPVLPDAPPVKTPQLKVLQQPSQAVDPVPFEALPVPQKEQQTALRQSSAVYIYQGRYVRITSSFSDMVNIIDGGVTRQVLRSELTQTNSTSLKQKVGRINVNTCIADDLLTLKPYGIRSKVIADKLIENRQNGYRDFAHFRQLNSYMSSINWNDIQSHVCFSDDDI